MAHEAYESLSRGASEPSYFAATDPRNYSSQFTTERPSATPSSASRDVYSSPPSTSSSSSSSTHVRQPSPDGKPTSHIPTDQAETAAQATVSPELIAELTERIKHEGVLALF